MKAARSGGVARRRRAGVAPAWSLLEARTDIREGIAPGLLDRERQAFEALTRWERERVLAFLNSLILFPPDDTASNLDPGDRDWPGFPQFRHGSIRLTVLFNNPLRIE